VAAAAAAAAASAAAAAAASSSRGAAMAADGVSVASCRVSLRLVSSNRSVPASCCET
jgi:hypothetical protein